MGPLATGGGGGASVQVKTKSVTETINSGSYGTRANSITYGNDAELVGFSLDANSWYRVDFSILFTTTSNSGFKLQIIHPSSPVQNGNNGWLQAPGVSQSTTIATTVTSVYASGAGRTIAGIVGFCHIYVGSSGGTLSMQWAQNASHADNTSLLANSKIRVEKL